MQKKPMLYSQRLMLRPVSAGDLPFFCELMGDLQVMRFITGKARSKAEVTEKLAAMELHWQSYRFGNFTVLLRESGEPLGYCGFKWMPMRIDEPELLYGLHPDFWGQGFALEAARVCLNHWQNELSFNRLWAALHPQNRASQHILEQLGMTRTHDIHIYDQAAADIYYFSRARNQIL